MIDKIINLKSYSLTRSKKSTIFLKSINKLTLHHYKNCKDYKKIIDNLKFKINSKKKLEDFPMIPVRMFKNFNLKSVSKNKIVKTLVSSGTSGQNPSRIYLDKENAINQAKALKNIMESVLGKKRLPMLIIDQNPNLTDRLIFNAKSAAIYGFSLFGKNYCYLLNKNGDIDYRSLNNFLKKFSKEKFFIFGFTSSIYENLICKLSSKLIYKNFQNGILLHGGGWKKLENLKINNQQFKQKLFNKTKIKNIYNYYGMVEQTGSIFIECKKCGYFITSNFSDIIIRDRNFEVAKKGTKGLIQLLSLLPTSYPGHNILTEDIGEIVEEKYCKCGIKGKCFVVHGRAKEAEIRGCSDVK